MSEPANRSKTGKFAPGQSGNPSGRPKLTEQEVEARRLVAEFTPEAVRLLIAHARSDDWRPSMDALKHLTPWLPKLQLELTGADGGPVQTVAIDPRRLSTATLDEVLGAVVKGDESGDDE